MLKKLLNLIDTVSEWTCRIFRWNIVIICILIIFEIIMRWIFNAPTSWSFEVMLQLYGLYFMIISAYTLLHDAHVSVDVFTTSLSKRSKAVLSVINYVLLFFPFMLVLLYEGILYAANSWAMHEKSWSPFAPPIYPIKTVIPIATFLLLIQGIAIFIRRLHMGINGEEL